MKTKLFLMLTISVAGILILPGCAKKQGCTNATATNYDADAEEDDGSCTYGVDLFEGNYSGTETVRKASDNSLVETKNVVFSIVKISDTQIKVIDFNAGDCDITANVSGSSFVGTTSSGCPWINSFAGSLNGNSLTYTYVNEDYTPGVQLIVNVSGTLTKL